MNWDDPAERFALIERVGVEAYNKAFKEHLQQSTVVTVCGHDIRKVGSRFGPLLQVGGTGRAYTLQQMLDMIYTIYSKEQEKEYGVLGIRIGLIDPP